MDNRYWLAILPAVALAACNSSEPAGEPSAAATSEAAPASAAAAAPTAPAGPAVAGSVPPRDFIVGSWGEDGDCALAIEFKADGSMVGPFEKWEYADGVLTMVGNPSKMHLKVVDDKTMESLLDGKSEPDKLTRC